MAIYTTAESKRDLEGILSLQRENLAQGLTPDEIKSQGFVTVCHSYDQLKKMNDHEKHVIAKDNDKVVAYVLAMTQHSKFDIPILHPMFEAFGTISYGGKKITDYNYLVVGQVCIDKAYRGQGLFDNCYAAYKKYFSQKYDFAITEIASTNLRSLNAHRRIGFQEVDSYIDPDNTKWIVVVWDWK
jgi:ribosomal protein S18 acetylase RimI-like enzyme